MRRIPVILGLLSIAYFGMAQSSFGLSVNAITNLNNETSVLLDNGDTYDYEFRSLGAKNTFSFGLNHRTDIGNRFYFHKEVLYTKSTQDFLVDDYSDRIGDGTAEVTTTKIQIPIAAGVRVSNFLVGVGPVINFNAKTERSANIGQIFRVEENKISTGMQVQLGFQLNSHLSVMGKYISTFNGPISGYYYNNEPVKLSGKQKQVSLGINYNL